MADRRAAEPKTRLFSMETPKSNWSWWYSLPVVERSADEGPKPGPHQGDAPHDENLLAGGRSYAIAQAVSQNNQEAPGQPPCCTQQCSSSDLRAMADVQA